MEMDIESNIIIKPHHDPTYFFLSFTSNMFTICTKYILSTYTKQILNTYKDLVINFELKLKQAIFENQTRFG